MNETNEGRLSDGLTEKAQDGTKSWKVMKDGEEPPDMLLALLNNVLPQMVDSQQVVILGTAVYGNRKVTLLAIYDVMPTANNTLLAVK